MKDDPILAIPPPSTELLDLAAHVDRIMVVDLLCPAEVVAHLGPRDVLLLDPRASIVVLDDPHGKAAAKQDTTFRTWWTIVDWQCSQADALAVLEEMFARQPVRQVQRPPRAPKAATTAPTAYASGCGPDCPLHGSRKRHRDATGYGPPGSTRRHRTRHGRRAHNHPSGGSKKPPRRF